MRCLIIFFFSSRRRHTRLTCDWSSDVCSSDLGPAWLADERTALPSLVAMATWRGFGFDMVIFLAALQGVPRELYEAADVDGAGTWAKFRRVTLPMLRPALLFTVVYSTIGYMQFLE